MRSPLRIRPHTGVQYSFAFHTEKNITDTKQDFLIAIFISYCSKGYCQDIEMSVDRDLPVYKYKLRAMPECMNYCKVVL